MTRPRLPIAIAVSLLGILTAVTPALALTWGPVQPISDTSTANAWRSGLVVRGSLIALAYRELDPDGRHIAFRRSTDGGATFSDPIEISRPEALASYQSSLAYAGGLLHATWVEADAASGLERALYRRSTDAGTTWSDPVVMTPESVGVVSSPRLFASSTRVYFAYTDGTTGQVYLRRSVDGGLTFQGRRGLGTTTNEGFSGSDQFDGVVSMAFGTGVSYAVWRSSERGIRLRRSTDGGSTWKPAVSIATRTGSDPMIAAAGSRAVIAMTYYDSATPEYVAIRRTSDKGATWTARKKVSSGLRFAYEPLIVREGSKWRLLYGQCGADGCEVSSALWYRSSADGVTWSSPQRLTPSQPTTRAIGLGYASGSGRTWAGWIAGAYDADNFNVFVRGGQ